MILLHPTRSQKCPMVGHSPAPMAQGKGVGGQRLRELRRATSQEGRHVRRESVERKPGELDIASQRTMCRHCICSVISSVPPDSATVWKRGSRSLFRM